MALGTKNRLQQTAQECRQYLRESHANQRELVEEYILEIEGPEHAVDPTQWNQFVDIKRSRAEMLQRLEAAFQQWLNG